MYSETLTTVLMKYFLSWFKAFQYSNVMLFFNIVCSAVFEFSVCTFDICNNKKNKQALGWVKEVTVKKNTAKVNFCILIHAQFLIEWKLLIIHIYMKRGKEKSATEMVNSFPQNFQLQCLLCQGIQRISLPHFWELHGQSPQRQNSRTGRMD